MWHPKEPSPRPSASPQPSPCEQRLEQSITSPPRAYLLRRRPARLLGSFEDKQGLGRAGIEGSGCHAGGCYSQPDVTMGRVAGPPASFGDHLRVPRWRSLGAGMGAQTRAPSSTQRGDPQPCPSQPQHDTRSAAGASSAEEDSPKPQCPAGYPAPHWHGPRSHRVPTRGRCRGGRLGQRGHFVPCSPLKLSCHI